jgi:hypothetical protein
MSLKSKIIDALGEFVERKSDTKEPILCTVKTVDNAAKTCYCEPVGDFADIQNVKLSPNKAIDGIIVFPKVNSKVYVSFTPDGSAYVSMFSEYDSYHIGGQSYGGIPKAGDTATRFNNIENEVQALKNVFAAWTPAANDGGAALKTAASFWFAGAVSTTTQAMIESTKTKHGDGTT